MNIRPIDVARFWDKVRRGEPNECWEWQACITRFGYGKMRLGNQHVGAHRISWMIAHPGEEIPMGLQTMHSCDNRRCVNPAHLSLGTAADNQRDKWLKGRAANQHQNGDANAFAKLTEEIVREIRTNPLGLSQAALARHHGVSRATVCYVVQRKRWGWLAD